MAGKPPASALDNNVFPEYYLIQLKGFSDVVEDALDEWLYAFKHSEVLEEFHSYNIDALKDKLDPLKMSESERKTYEATMRAKASIADSVATFKAEHEQTLAEVKGEHEQTLVEVKGEHEQNLVEVKDEYEQNLVEVKAEGLVEGERKNSVIVVINCLKQGMEVGIISKITGLTPKEVEEIKSNITSL